MRIKATKIYAENLKAGDLFSFLNQLYWDRIKSKRSIGEKIYIRTEEPCPIAEKEKEEIYKITIEL